MQGIERIVESFFLLHVITGSVKQFPRAQNDGLLGFSNQGWNLGAVGFEQGRNIYISPASFGRWGKRYRSHNYCCLSGLPDRAVKVPYRATGNNTVNDVDAQPGGDEAVEICPTSGA
jgi:hypothetical protein